MDLTVRTSMAAVASLLVLWCAACGGSSSSSPSAQGGSNTDSSTATEDSGAATSTPANTSTDSGGPTMTIDYTSPAGWHYAGRVPWPQYNVTFSTDTSSSPPGSARFSTSVSGAPATSGSTGIATGLTDDNPGRPNGPSLVMGVEIVYRIDANSPVLTAGQCSAKGPNARQDGYPFDDAMDCTPPQSLASSPETGSTDDLPQGQVASLVSKLTNEQPWYVLTFGAANGEIGCTVFIAPSHNIQEVEARDANSLSPSDCRKMTLTLGQ